MSRFIVTLTDEERATLEKKRAQLGLRSMADVIRYWIALGRDNPHNHEWSEREVAAIHALGPRPPLKLNRIGPIDALTGKPLGPRKVMQKGEKR